MWGYTRTGLLVLVVFMAGGLFVACAGFEESAYTGPVEGYVTGLVTEVPEYQEEADTLVRKAEPIPGVRVFTKAGDETFTDQAGHFLLKVEPAERILVHFEEENHTSSIKTTSVGDWKTATVMVVLKRREVFQVSNIQNGVSVTTTDGVKVTIHSDSVVLPTGEPASGAARVACTLINPRNSGEIEAAPGNFTAVDPRAPDASEAALLRSYGMLEMVVTQDGEPLAFKDGAAATVTVPFSKALPDDDPRQQGAPLWYFDQKRARWIQHGDAQVVEDGEGARFEATVTTVDDYDSDDDEEFSPDGGVDGGDDSEGGDRPPWKPPTYPPKWWNIDVYGDPTGIKGRVVDAVDNGLPGAQVMVYVPADGQHTYTHTGDDGRFELYPVLANALNEVFAMLVVGSQAYSSALHHYVTTKTSPDPSTYEWVPVKEDETSTIEIPVCFLAGHVRLAYTLVKSGEEETESTVGFAQFHNVLGGRDWCVDSFFRDEGEECRIVKLDEMEELKLPGPEPLEYYSAGSHVSLKGGQEYCLVQKQGGGDIRYEELTIGEACRRPLFEKNYNVSAPGEKGGLPHFTSNVPLFMPKMVTPLGALGEPDPEIDSGRALDLIWESSESTHHIYFIAHAADADGGSDCLLCRLRDDGYHAVPASMLDSLGKGPANFMLFRYFVDYFALPSGAAVETVGQTGVSIQGRLY